MSLALVPAFGDRSHTRASIRDYDQHWQQSAMRVDEKSDSRKNIEFILLACSDGFATILWDLVKQPFVRSRTTRRNIPTSLIPKLSTHLSKRTHPLSP